MIYSPTPSESLTTLTTSPFCNFSKCSCPSSTLPEAQQTSKLGSNPWEPTCWRTAVLDAHKEGTTLLAHPQLDRLTVAPDGSEISDRRKHEKTFGKKKKKKQIVINLSKKLESKVPITYESMVPTLQKVVCHLNGLSKFQELWPHTRNAAKRTVYKCCSLETKPFQEFLFFSFPEFGDCWRFRF